MSRKDIHLQSQCLHEQSANHRGGGTSACRPALNASGNMSFFKRYQLVASLMAAWEPHLSDGWAALNDSCEYKAHIGTALICKCTGHTPREASVQRGHDQGDKRRTERNQELYNGP